MLARRALARLHATPDARLRRLLIALYLLTAIADSAGKTLATLPAVNRAIAARVGDANAANVRTASRPIGNFEIFRLASRHLVAQIDMYAEYPAVHVDRFMYSPTFALLFTPFALIVWPLALVLWSLLNALVLFAAVERALPGRAGLFAMLYLHLEVLRAMQNAQSNALVAGLVILAYVALERRSAWRAAFSVGLGAAVKIFPLAALTFAIPSRMVLRTGLWTLALGVLLIALPLAVTSPSTLVQQYAGWRGVEDLHMPERWFSVMALLHRLLRVDWPNWPVQLAGTLALMAPLALRRDRWDEARFRYLYLCSLLLYVELFNHQAERASYVVAFTGATLWFAGSPRSRMSVALYLLAFVTTPLMSTLIPGAVFKTATVMTYRLVLPSLLIWIAVNAELYRGMQGAVPARARRSAADPDRRRLDVLSTISSATWPAHSRRRSFCARALHWMTSLRSRPPEAPLQHDPRDDARDRLEGVRVKQIPLDRVGHHVGRGQDREQGEEDEQCPLRAGVPLQRCEPDREPRHRDDERRAFRAVIEDDAEDQDGGKILQSELPLLPST